jgi:hypothetical protein
VESASLLCYRLEDHEVVKPCEGVVDEGLDGAAAPLNSLVMVGVLRRRSSVVPVE